MPLINSAAPLLKIQKNIHYGVLVTFGVETVSTSDVDCVLSAPSLVCASGQPSKSTGKSVQLPLTQIFNERGVFSGPRHNTTCLPLLTSIVAQLTSNGLFVADGVEEATSNVAVSGKTSNACAILSTQNWHSTRTISRPVTGIAGVFPVPVEGETMTVGMGDEILSGLLTTGVARTVVDKSVVGVSSMMVLVSCPLGKVLVSNVGSVVPIKVGVAPGRAPHAVVSNNSTNVLVKNAREKIFILSSP